MELTARPAIESVLPLPNRLSPQAASLTVGHNGANAMIFSVLQKLPPKTCPILTQKFAVSCINVLLWKLVQVGGGGWKLRKLVEVDKSSWNLIEVNIAPRKLPWKLPLDLPWHFHGNFRY